MSAARWYTRDVFETLFWKFPNVFEKVTRVKSEIANGPDAQNTTFGLRNGGFNKKKLLHGFSRSGPCAQTL